MIGLLLDEMYPSATARLLRDRHGLDAVHVAEIGLRATDDAVIAQRARTDQRSIVTEKVADFAVEHDVVLVVVLKRYLPAGGALAPALADVLRRWSKANPDPYVGHHWPD